MDEDFEYLVLFCKKKLIVKVKEKKNFLTEVERVFGMELNPDLIKVRIFNAKYAEYVDSKLEDLPDDGKIELTMQIEESADETSIPDTLPVDTSDLDDLASMASTSSTASFSTTSSTCSSMQLPIPIPYVVSPQLFPPKLLEKMRTIRLNQKERSEVLDCVYDDITGQYHTYYLSAFQYDMIADGLLRNFPKLREGLHIDGAKALLHKRLRDKFKNTRKRTDSHVPCVKNKKKKMENSDSPSATPSKKFWGVKNFAPSRREADDDQTIKSYVEFMQQQAKLDKGRRKQEQVLERMQWTLPERRAAITQDFVPIAELMVTYPILFDEDEIIREMNSLTEADTEVKFNQNLEIYSKKILQMKPVKKEGNDVQELRKRVAAAEDAEKIYLTKSVALLTIPFYVNEKAAMFYRPLNEDDQSPGAHICWEGSLTDILNADMIYTIKVEGNAVCHTKSLSRAFLLLMCSYYVFNLEYKKGTQSMLHFMQRVLLDIDDGTVAKDTKLLNFLTKINKV